MYFQNGSQCVQNLKALETCFAKVEACAAAKKFEIGKRDFLGTMNFVPA